MADSTPTSELEASESAHGSTAPARDKKKLSTDPNVRNAAKPIAPGTPVEPSPAPAPNWEGATHYVQYSHVIREVADTADKKAVPLRDAAHHQYQPVEYISGTGEVHIKLLEANLGAYWDLSLIQLEPEGDEAGYYYIESIHLFPVQGVENVTFYSPEDAELAEEIVDSVKETKIKDLEVSVPYEENSHYNIVLDCATISKEEYESQIEQFKRDSICKLLEFYGKKALDPDVITKLVQNPFGIIQCSEPYFPLRPGQNIKTKVSIAKKYFNSFENATFDDFVVDNIHEDFLAISIKANEFEKIISDLISTFDKYHKQVTKFAGTLEGLNYNKLGIKMKKFESEFKKFLVLNEIQLDTRDADATFEFGFDKNTFRLRYVIYFNSAGTFCSTGLSTFSGNFDPKIGKVLVQYRDMLSSSINGVAWMSFSTEFFAGDIEINFNSASGVINSAKTPLSQLEGDMDILKADFDNMKYMTPLDASGLAKTIGGSEFRETASELLMRSRDFIGDQFLVDLPNILNNVDDLASLYNMVFDKVSVKDLLDMVMEQAMEELNLPDVQEVKLRGILQALDHKFVLETLFDSLEMPDLQDIISQICDINTFGIKEYENLVDSMPTIPMFSLYMVHFRGDGTLGGLLPEEYAGDIMQILDDQNIGDCVSLVTAIATKQFDITDFFQETAINKIMCQVLTQGIDSLLPQFTNPCPDILPTLQSMNMEALSPIELNLQGAPQFKSISFGTLKFDILSFLKNLDKSMIMPSVDVHLKELFKLSNDGMSATLAGTPPDISVPTPPELFNKFAEIPAIKIELEKLNQTKAKLTGKIPGLPLDFETKKIDADFELPSIKDCNPSFDFGKFQFSAMQDLFGGAVGGIEDALIKGIEAGLVAAFKSILKGVVDSITANPPNLDSPNFGGLNMNDLLDATDGFSADAFAGMTMDLVNKAASKFNPDFFTDLCEELVNIAEFSASEEDILDMIDDMSSALKPLELLRIMKGQTNDRDMTVMRDAIESDALKQLMTDDIMDHMLGVATDFMDFDMLDELENAYSQKEQMIAVCNDRGIPYGVRDIRQNLVDKYEDLDTDEINDLVDTIVDETKDSLVDAIAAGAKGALGGDYTDSLPFNEDPCSFMPKPADIPALNFSNNMVFDSIFDPIELEYKAEAVGYADMLLQPETKKEYVKLYYDRYDFILDSDEPYNQDSQTGEYTLNMKQVGEYGVYNQDFSNHYKGKQTPVYRRSLDGRYIEIDPFVGSYDLKKNEIDEWEIKDDKDQIYVESTDQKLKPVPGLKYFYENPAALFSYNVSQKKYKIRFKVTNKAVDEAVYEMPEPEDRVEPEVVLTFALTASQVRTDTFSDSNTECKEDQTLLAATDDASAGSSYPDRIINSIRDCSTKIISMGEYFATGLPVSFEHNLEDTYDTTKRLTPMGVPQGEMWQKSMTHSLIHAFVDVMFKKISATQLFETSYLQTFLFDTDSVNLFKVQEAKNEAKDDFNDECSFTEDGENKLKSSSINKLIYLTFRLYLIEIMARSCFLFDSINIKSMNGYLCSMLYDMIETDMSKYKNGYYELFKGEYEKEYGSTYPDSSVISEKDAFYKLAAEIYENISSEFDELFPNATSGDDMVEAFLNEIPIYDDERGRFPLYCTLAFFENKPFVIQRIQRQNMNILWPDSSPYGVTNMKENFYAQKQPSSDPAGVEYSYRLCYIKRIDGQYSEIRPADAAVFPRHPADLATIMDNYYNTQGITLHQPVDIGASRSPQQLSDDGASLTECTQAAYMLMGSEDERVLESDQLTGYKWRMLHQTLAFRTHAEFSFETGDPVYAQFEVVPLAETIFPANEDGDSSLTTWRTDPVGAMMSQDYNSDSIYDFLTNKVELNSYFNTIISANNSRILFDKPDIAIAFSDTKLAIKRAIEALNKDDNDYEHEDQETKDIELEQSQGTSTEPEFSGKAAKMALMTVPMIIKGAAEMFDPNIKVSKGIRLGADLAGFNIPPPVASLMGLPLNLIPFAPGPPITPLGLLYLATSFLEPKERKKLSDLRRGKNINDAASEAGEFIEGSVEEQAEAARELAMVELEKLLVKKEALIKTFQDYRATLKGITEFTINVLDGHADDGLLFDTPAAESRATALPCRDLTSHPLPMIWGTGNLNFGGFTEDTDGTWYYTSEGSNGPANRNPAPAPRLQAYGAGQGVCMYDTYKEYMESAMYNIAHYGGGTPTDGDIILLTFNHIKNTISDLFPSDGLPVNPYTLETGAMAYGYTPDNDNLAKWYTIGDVSEPLHWGSSTPTGYTGTEHPDHFYHGVNPGASHSCWYDWHSLFLKYCDKLSNLPSNADSYQEFHENDKFRGGRLLLQHMEAYEYIAGRLVVVLASHIIDILTEGESESLPGIASLTNALMGSAGDDIRKANLKTGTAVVPHVSPIEVLSYQYPDFQDIAVKAGLEYYSEKGLLTANPGQTRSVADQWAAQYRKKGTNTPSQNWSDRALRQTAISQAVKLLTGDGLDAIIQLLANEAESLL